MNGRGDPQLVRRSFATKQNLPNSELIYIDDLIETASEHGFSAVLKPLVSFAKSSSASCDPGQCVRAFFSTVATRQGLHWGSYFAAPELLAIPIDVGLTAKRQEDYTCSRSS